ncbi:MAG: hypothetical protein K0Q47_545 [Sedimentibacter sp.]|jgi:hypothetical protein|nr:hypothetical protein [Sedimentibacter sp.]
MFTSILTTTTESLSAANAIVCLISSLVLGLAIALTYMSSKNYSKNFVVTLVLMPILVQLVIMMVNGNLGTGVAVMGAFSLVRFRSVPGSSKEISFIFFAMAVGIATGMGFITFAAAATAAICLVFMSIYKSGFGNSSASERSLKITIPENLDYTNVFDDLFERYLKSSDLLKVKTTNLGSMFELHYDVVLKEIKEEKSFIDDIRCRNGNLTIICSRKHAQNEEL